MVLMEMSQHKTIASVLERGEKLDDLVDRSASLSASTKMFYKSAKRVSAHLQVIATLNSCYPTSKTLVVLLCDEVQFNSASILLTISLTSWKLDMTYPFGAPNFRP